MILLALMACFEIRVRPPPLEVQTLEDLWDLPMARRVLLEAEAHPRFASQSVSTHSVGRGLTVTRVLGVVPLTERGGDPTVQPVKAWAYYNGQLSEGKSVKRMVLYFTDEFNQEQTLGCVLGQRPNTGWHKAVKDAESRWGLESHPNARVVEVPSEPRN